MTTRLIIFAGLLLCLFVAIYIIEAYFVHQKAYFVKLFNETSHVIMVGSVLWFWVTY